MGLAAFDDGDVLIATELHRAARSIFFTLGLACFLLLVLIAVSQYFVDQLTNEEFGSARDVLLRAEEYLPASARVQARLAEVTALSNLSKAESHARRAVNLSRDNYKYWLTLAAVKAKQGDIRAAEQALRQATDLAPYDAAVRLRLAKLLGEQGRITEAIAEFRRGTVMDHSSLPDALDFTWRISNGNVKAVEEATNDDPRAQLILAHFLLDKSRGSDAARVFGQIKDRALLDSSVGATFLNNLMTAGHLKSAHDLWLRLVGSADAPLLWNGNFEQDLFTNFTQFDWTIEPSEFASIAIDPNTAHTGSRSLRMDFRGRETTTLNNEIRQLILLNPGARYRLQGYVKTERLTSPQGPRVVVHSVEASVWLGASVPIAEGSSDWQLLTFDFQTSQPKTGEVVPVLVTIKRTPVPSYDGPSRGTVWFDDFTLTRIEK